MLLSSEKSAFHASRNPNTGHEENTRGGTSPKMMGTPPFPGIRPHPGERASRPREGTFPRPPLVEFDGGAPSYSGGT